MELETGAMLSDLLADADKAYKLPKGVKEDIKSLRQSVEERLLPGLRMITVEKGPMDAKFWAREAAGLLNDIEHAVDNFRARISASTVAHPPGGLKALIGKINLKWATAKARRQLATNIKDLKQRTRRLDRRPRQEASTNVHRETVSMCAWPEEELVGIDRRRDELVQILTEEGSTSNRQHKIVSILGVPGVGKTTLAQVVYNRVAKHFNSAVWVHTERDNIATLEVLLRQISWQDGHHQPVPSHPNLTSPKNFETRLLNEVRAALKDKSWKDEQYTHISTLTLMSRLY